MPYEKKSILQPKNDVVFKALFSRGKTKDYTSYARGYFKDENDKLELDKVQIY